MPLPSPALPNVDNWPDPEKGYMVAYRNQLQELQAQYAENLKSLQDLTALASALEDVNVGLRQRAADNNLAGLVAEKTAETALLQEKIKVCEEQSGGGGKSFLVRFNDGGGNVTYFMVKADSAEDALSNLSRTIPPDSGQEYTIMGEFYPGSTPLCGAAVKVPTRVDLGLQLLDTFTIIVL